MAIFNLNPNPNLIVCSIIMRQANNSKCHMLHTITTQIQFSSCLQDTMFQQFEILNFCHVYKVPSSDSLTFVITAKTSQYTQQNKVDISYMKK